MELKQKKLEISKAFKKDNSKIIYTKKNLSPVTEATKHTTLNVTFNLFM